MPSGLEETAQELTVKRRAVLAKVYNENLAMYDWQSPEPANQFHQAVTNQIQIKLENNVEMLQGTIQHLQNRIGIEDLTEEEVADLQMVLMNDEDDFTIAADDNEIENQSGSLVENEDAPLDEEANVNEPGYTVQEPRDSMQVNANEPSYIVQEPRELMHDSISGDMGYIVNVCLENFTFAHVFTSIFSLPGKIRQIFSSCWHFNPKHILFVAGILQRLES